MSLRALSYLAVSLPFTLVACTGADADVDPGAAAQEANYTSDAGDAGDAGDASDAAPSSPVEVGAFTLADVGPTPKLRFSYDGSAAVDAIQTEWVTAISGTDRRFRLQGATPVAGGKPVFAMEFGRGAALIEKTTYDCASTQAVVVIVDRDGTKKITAVQGGPQRACKVVIDDLREAPRLSPTAKPTWHVVGHVEADVGPREDAAAPAKSVRATFAAWVHDSSQ